MFQRIAIIGSQEDPAARTIRAVLLQHEPFKETGEIFDGTPLLRWDPVPRASRVPEVFLATVQEQSTHCEFLDQCGHADLVLIISRHKSESGAPAFLTHCTGNWTERVDQGGRSREVARSAGRILWAAVRALHQRNMEANLGFAVSLEVTHHGPTTNKVPIAYIELGSSEIEWENATYAAVVAQAAMDVATTANVLPDADIYLGFGGPHYAPNFTRLAFERSVSPACTAHIVPKYFIRDLTIDQILQAIKQVVEPVAGFLLDWKGLNAADRAHLLPILRNIDLPILRVDQLLRQQKPGK